MPRSLQAWYGHDELEALADRNTVLSGELRVGKLTRLEGLVHAESSSAVAVTLTVRRSAAGRLLLEAALQAALVVTCQRCLERLEWRVDEKTEWLVVDSAADTDRNDRQEPTVVLDAGRLNVGDLLEDELIVAMPMAPRHESIDDCGPLAQNFRTELRDAASDQVVGSRDAS